MLILIHPRHSSIHLSIDATHYEVCQDTHHRGLRTYNNAPKLPQTHRNVIEMEDSLLQKEVKNGKVHTNCGCTLIAIHHRHSLFHFSLDQTNYEACQNTHGRGLRNI